VVEKRRKRESSGRFLARKGGFEKKDYLFKKKKPPVGPGLEPGGKKKIDGRATVI